MKYVSEFLAEWDLAPLPIILLLLAASGYLWGVDRLRRLGSRPWPAPRTTAYLFGLALIALVVIGPVGAFDDIFLWAHMAQHIVLMMVAAPLLVLGAPVSLILQACTPAARKRYVVPVIRSRAARWLTRPSVGWLLYVGTVLGAHFTPFYNYAVTHPLVHNYVEHALFLSVALVYYYPLLGANPVPHGPDPLVKIVSLFLQMAPMALTGFFIYSARSVLYPAYLVADRPFGPAALADQQVAGAMMWCAAMLIDVVWLTFAIRAWLRSEERKAERSDRQIAAERLRSA
ncbi:MAG: cytochrome c oxidase assembly protein [Cellulomonas sp.]